MMKFNFRDLEVPPDGYRAAMPDGTIIHATDRASWYSKIKQHHEWNSLPLADNWKEQYEDQLCHVLPAGWARYENGETSQGITNVRIDMGYVFRGMEVMLNIVSQGQDAFVDQETAEARAKICAGCPANINVDGCAPCIGLSNKIMDIIGPRRQTSADHVLRTCGPCGCSARASVHIKPEILAKGVTADQMVQFRKLDWCWKGREIDEVQLI